MSIKTPSDTPTPNPNIRHETPIKVWFGKVKRHLGYYEARNRISEPKFRRALRHTDTFLLGHPKSGHTWLAYMLALLMAEEKDPIVNLLNVGNFVPFVHGRDHDIARYEHLPNPRVFRNEKPVHHKLYPRILYIIRDPRAVLVSYWHMYRVLLGDEDTSLESFIDQYLKGTGCFTYWNKHIVRWDRQVKMAFLESEKNDRLHVVRYEDLVENRRIVLEGITHFLDLPPHADRLSLAVERGSFRAMRAVEDQFGAEAYKGRAKGAGSFVRQGKVDGWVYEMDGAISARICNEFGSIMAEAGYD